MYNIKVTGRSIIMEKGTKIRCSSDITFNVYRVHKPCLIESRDWIQIRQSGNLHYRVT